MSERTMYVLRTQSNRAYTWGLGEPVAEGVLLFREGFYDLDAEQLAAKLKETGKAVLQ